MLSFFVPKPSQKGFTILEVMIAMAIFAIGILGVAKLQIKSTTGNTTARTITEATTFAVDRVERLISLPYSNSALDQNTAATPFYTDPTPIIGFSSGETYTRRWVITDNNPIANTKQITMTVTWNDQGRTRSFSTNYYRSRDY